MTVFIGWAGETSKEIASILTEWLNGMFDWRIKVYTPSSYDMMYPDILDDVISTADCGLLCITEDNINSQWLSYEAGALRRNGNEIFPILFDVHSQYLREPLSRLQPFKFQRDDMWKFLCNLCDIGNRIEQEENKIVPFLYYEQIQRSFQARYPTLEALLMKILSERKSQFSSEPDEWERAERKLDTLLSLISEETKELKNKIAELEEQIVELEKQIANNEKIIDKLENRHFFANFFRKNPRHDRETDS